MPNSGKNRQFNPELSGRGSRANKSPPRIAFVRQKFWDSASAFTQDALSQLAKSLGDSCVEADLPAIFDEGANLCQKINHAEMAHELRGYADRGFTKLSPRLQGALRVGFAISLPEIHRALAQRDELAGQFGAFMSDYDAIITPAVPDFAPESLKTLGNFDFCALWSLLGAPAVSLPLFKGANGMPLGVQVVGRCKGDIDMLSAADWISANASMQIGKVSKAVLN